MRATGELVLPHATPICWHHSSQVHITQACSEKPALTQALMLPANLIPRWLVWAFFSAYFVAGGYFNLIMVGGGAA